MTEEELRPHLTALRRYALSIARDRSMADDLVQEALKRFITYRGDLTTEYPRAYLFRVLRNVRNDALAKANKAVVVSVAEIDPSLLTTEGEVMGRLALRDVRLAFARLPQNQRDTLSLVALRGLSYKEAARMLHVPIGTVMSRVNRARAALKQALEGEPVPAAAE